MLFPRISKTDPDFVFVGVIAGEALLQGYPVCYHFSGTNDGKIGWLANAATDGPLVAGIANSAIASGAYGLVQAYGFRSDVPVMGASAFAVDGGAILGIASSSSGCLYMISSVGAAGAAFAPFVAANSVTLASTATPALMGVFIRCM